MANQKKASAQSNSDEMMKLIKIILILVVIVVVFYGLTIIITKFKKDEENKPQEIPAVIQYDEIIIGNLLNQKRNEYFVLIEKEDSPYNSLFNTYMQSYSTKNALKIYTANMDSIFNASYIAEQSVLNVNDITRFKVSDMTLLKVKDHAVVEYYEGVEAIENKFKQLIK